MQKNTAIKEELIINNLREYKNFKNKDKNSQGNIDETEQNEVIYKIIKKKNKNIHKTAVVEKGATIGENTVIGAFCYIGANVIIGDNCTVKHHAVIEGNTTIGDNNHIYSFVVIGQDPQDLKYEGENSRIEIGDNNKIREYVTIHPGTKGDRMLTTVGSNNLFMVGVHIAHDCVVGNDCILANNATLAGHVHLGNGVVIGGLSAVHQWTHIGNYAMIAGMTGVGADVIPYGMLIDERNPNFKSLNIIGMKRSNINKEEINNLRHFFKDVFEAEEGNLSDLVEKFKNDYEDSEVVKEVVNFLNKDNKRSFSTKSKK